MATIQKRDRSYRVRIRRKGFPTLTASFDTRTEADAWARQRESDMDRGVVHVTTVEAERTTVADLIDRYVAEVTVTHKGEESETYRLRSLARGPLGPRYVAAMRAKDVAEWRKARLQEVGPSSVAREMNLLHRVFELARLEWGIGDNNPVTKVKRPPAPPGRDRRLEGGEETRLLAACRKARNPWLEPIAICAIETAMRRSELLGLCWTDLNLATGTAKLGDTKNGDARTVPHCPIAPLRPLPRSRATFIGKCSRPQEML